MAKTAKRAEESAAAAAMAAEDGGRAQQIRVAV